MKYSDLIQFATVRQIEYIEAIEKFGEVGRRVLPIQEVRERLGKAKGAKVTREREVFAV